MRYILLLIGFCFAAPAFGQIRLSGYIYELGSHESLPGVVVRIKGSSGGVLSNNYGFYSILVPSGNNPTVSFGLLGYQSISKNLSTATIQTLNIELSPIAQTLNEVQIQADLIAPSEMSMVRLPIEQIKQMPTLLGEKDIIKALQLLPGVQKGVEGSTALYVRGGGADQNLILLDEAPVYNANHLFGFFNSGTIRNITSASTCALTIELTALDQTMYKYMLSYENYKNWSINSGGLLPNFREPQPIYSNVSGGIGVFGGFNQYNAIISVKK